MAVTAADWMGPLVAGVGGVLVTSGIGVMRQRLSDASRLQRRVSRLEVTQARTGRVVARLIQAHSRAATAQRAGRSAEQILADLLDVHAWVIRELAEGVEDEVSQG